MNLNTRQAAPDPAEICKRISEGLKAFTGTVTEFASNQQQVPALRSDRESVVRGLFRR
jgi:hypothetical protein